MPNSVRASRGLLGKRALDCVIATPGHASGTSQSRDAGPVPPRALQKSLQFLSRLPTACLSPPMSVLAARGALRGLLRLRQLPGSSRSQVAYRRKMTTAAMASVKDDYAKLCDLVKETASLEGISGLLGWDEQVMMPAQASASRGAQKAALAGVIHEKATNPELGKLLERLQQGATHLDQWEQAVVRDVAIRYKRKTAIPKDLAQRIARLESEAFEAWVGARKASDWAAFAPFLQQWVDVTLDKTQRIDPSRPAYDVCLDEFERSMTSARLDEVFQQVQKELVPFLKELRERGVKPDASVLAGTFDVDKQAALCRQVALDIGFDLQKGRLDVSVHPFTGGAHPTDVRMTTRYKETDFTEGLTGTIHETGHALYEQGRNLSYDGLPVNEALSMGIHESQSLLWERMVGLSLPFSRYLAGKAASVFPSLASASPDALYHAMNQLTDPPLIRVESDEVQYPLHIVLRYEIEKGLLDGSVRVADVPALWNRRMEELLGCRPGSDAQGALQDVHWSAGVFGYFPTYLIGAIAACQIFEAARAALPTLDEDIAAGQFQGLREWLREKVHSVGSLHPSGDDLMRAVTGAPLDPSVFLRHLKTKYAALYQL